MSVFLGVLVAMSFGSGDFLGGNASRNTPTISVLITVQAVALLGAVAFAVIFGGHAAASDFGLGLAAGTCNVIALGCLYAGLATGRMGLVAPLTAVIAACIPVAWGLSRGEDLSTLTLTGVVLAIGAAGLIAREHDSDVTGDNRRAFALAVAAGVLFGVSLVLYTQTSHDSGAWPVLAGRVSAVVIAVTAGLFVRAKFRLDPTPRRMAIGAGLLDVTATAMVLAAVRRGLISVVTPIAALGPAFTVVLAWRFLREPISRMQVVGLVVAIAALVMIAAG